MFEKDEIYEDEYEGWYSESEEMFYAEEELVDGKSPLGKEVVRIKERNYFFRMGAYQQQLIDYINDNPEFIQPKGKRSEVIGFLRQPLSDLCISRPKTRLEWGVELPFDKDYVTYVWFDALLNYASAVGYRQDAERAELFDTQWPHVRHLIGKDILITHSVYWPTMLMALGLPLPRTIFAHGWWLTADDKKMSKSEGEVVRPLDMKDIVGVDALRYFLMRAMNPAQDGQFSKDLVISRVNTELANTLGNLLNRSTGLVVKHFEGKVPVTEITREESKALISQAEELAEKVRGEVEQFLPNRALEHIFELLMATNRYLDVLAPWKAIKEGQRELTAESLYVTLEVLRICGILLNPVMPEKSRELLKRVGAEGEIRFEDSKRFKALSAEASVIKGDALFPRVE